MTSPLDIPWLYIAALVLSFAALQLPMPTISKNVKKVRGRKEVKVMKAMKKLMDYNKMKKRDIPHGHYFAWVDFHSKKLMDQKLMKKKLTTKKK